MMKRNRITFSRQQRARFGRRPFSLPHSCNEIVLSGGLSRGRPRYQRRGFFPLNLAQLWDELSEWNKFFVLALFCVHLVLALLWAWYRLQGE